LFWSAERVAKVAAISKRVPWSSALANLEWSAIIIYLSPPGIYLRAGAFAFAYCTVARRSFFLSPPEGDWI